MQNVKSPFFAFLERNVGEDVTILKNDIFMKIFRSLLLHPWLQKFAENSMQHTSASAIERMGAAIAYYASRIGN